MKKIISIFTLLCLLVLSTMVFADTSHSPKSGEQQIETSNEVSWDFESTVLTPINFVEVEISPGDIMVSTVYNKQTLFPFKEMCFISNNPLQLSKTYTDALHNSLITNIPTKDKIKLKKDRCLLLFSTLNRLNNNYIVKGHTYKEVRIRGVNRDSLK